jgi:hypothetical protein
MCRSNAPLFISGDDPFTTHAAPTSITRFRPGKRLNWAGAPDGNRAGFPDHYKQN